jgi:AcrR family transcriptional regulator
MSPSQERLDPRVKRTRKLVLDAFFSLLNERGFESITVADIAERATVNRVTIYAHFEDKYALLEHAIGVKFQAMLNQHLPANAARDERHLKRLLTALCEFVAEDDRRCGDTNRHFKPLIEREVKANLAAVLEGWVIARSCVPRALVAAMASAAAYAAASHWSQDEQGGSAAVFADGIIPMVLAMLGAERG